MELMWPDQLKPSNEPQKVMEYGMKCVDGEPRGWALHIGGFLNINGTI